MLVPWLRALVGIGILVALVARLGTGAVLEGVRAIDAGSVFAALAIGLLTTVLSAWRWCLVARGLGLRLPLAAAVAACYRSVFLNSVLPSGVLGDLHRGVSHGRSSGDLGRGVRAVVYERTAGLLVLVVVGVGVLLARPPLPVDLDLSPGGFALLAALAAVLAVVVLRTGRLRRALRTALEDARTGLCSLGTWPWVVLLSAATLAGYLALFVIAAREAGSTAALGELLPLLLLALFAMGLPLSVGGWGPREAVATAAFGAVGLGAQQGLTVAVVYGTLSLIACLPGLGMLLLPAPVQPVPPAGDTH